MRTTTGNSTSHPAPRTVGSRRRRRAAATALLLSGALLLAACGDDASAPDPTEADTGVPLLEGTADPAAEPTTDIAPSD